MFTITPNELFPIAAIGIFMLLIIELGVIMTALKNTRGQYITIIIFGILMLLGGAWMIYYYLAMIKTNSEQFQAGKELLCDGEKKTIVSLKAGYVHRDGYFIKDKEIIDDTNCRILP